MNTGHRRERSRIRKTAQRQRGLEIAFVASVVLLSIGVALIASCASSDGPSTPTTDAVRPTTITSAASITTVPSSSTASSVSTTNATNASGGTAGDSTSTTVADHSAASIVKHGPTDRNWIALTFDDNYQGANASETLAVLRQYDVPATLFVIGHYIDTGPDLAREIAAGGFEVGDHTRSHANCAKLSKRGLRIEIGNGTDHYRALTGAPTVRLFRPPGGFVDQKTCEVAAEKGFEYVVMWDVDTNDWRGRTAAQITETVMGNAHNGAIILMHMGAKHTAEALPNIIKRLRDAGHELVALTTMLGVTP